MRVNNGQGIQQQKVDSPLGFYSLELFQYPLFCYCIHAGG